MSVKLRLRRMGRKKRPIWSVVATDSRSPRDGRHIEDLGRYRPLQQPALVELNEERVLYWLEQGAIPSDTVRSLLSKRGLMLALHLRRKGTSEEGIAEAVGAHREARAEKDEKTVKTTPEARRQQALEAERKRIEELEAEEARRREEEERKRKEAEAKAKEEAAAKAKAEAEAETKAAEEAEDAADAEANEEQEGEDEGTEENDDEAEATDATDEASEEDAEADEETEEDAASEEDEAAKS